MKGLTRPCADFAESKDVDAKAIISQHRACAKTDFLKARSTSGRSPVSQTGEAGFDSRTGHLADSW